MTDRPGMLDELRADEAPAVAALTRRLRAAVRAAHPDLRDRVYPGWHRLGLHHPVGGHLAALFRRDEGVHLGLEHGADLPDLHGLLTGTGRRLRYLRFSPAARTPTDEQLIDYLDLAVGHAVALRSVRAAAAGISGCGAAE